MGKKDSYKFSASVVKDNFLLLLLSVTCLFSIGIGEYFLIKRNNLISMPPLPIVKDSNPYFDWNTFTSDEEIFEIKYPNNFSVVEDQITWPNSVLILSKGNRVDDLVIESWENETQYKSKYNSGKYINSIKIQTFGTNTYTLLNVNNDPQVEEIISTFKFLKTPPTPGTTGVSCTMEALECPDGSFVGRSGPKCEFSPCP